MALPIVITDGAERKAILDKTGAVPVAEGNFDLTKSNTMTATTAYNFYLPVSRMQFIVTGILVFAQKSVSATDGAIITVYEADAPDSTVVGKEILKVGIGALDNLPYPNVRLLVSEGVWINAKVDDPTVILNIIGHFIPTIMKDVSSFAGVV